MTEQAQPSGPEYEFTNDWFNQTASLPVWRQIISNNKPTKILEIGSFEGRSTCWLIETCTMSNQSDIQICCVDSWEGGIEHKKGAGKSSEMSDVEERFDRNISVAKSKVKFNSHIRKIKHYSHQALPMLMSEGKYEFFDLIYIDGSHQAPDVLCDAVLAFKLLRINGIMVFDDYLWQEKLPYGVDLIRCPKAAIDAFTNIFCRKINIITAPLYQLYVQKISN